MPKKDKVDTKSFKDVEMSWVEDDIEKIQNKPNLYLMKYGSAGCNHMAREIIQNSYDEEIDTDSPGSKVTVKVDTLVDQLTVIDDGRGFPETKFPLDIFCTKLQSGSKSTRSQSGGTAGEFGVGATVVNALSTKFSIRNYRKDENYIHTIEFEYGKKVKDKFEKNPKGLHGSEVSFIPDRKYLGKNAHIDVDGLYQWIDALSYLLGSEKKKIVTYFEEWNGLKLVRKEKISSKPFSELLGSICKKPITTQVDIHKRGKIEEVDINEKKSKKNILIEVSFAYDGNSNPDIPTQIDSYCNYTNTIDGGVHVTTVDSCICRYLQNETRNSLSDREKEKIDILWQDIRTDLRVVINLSSDAQVQFMGNAKTQIGNENLVPVIKDLVNEGLKEFFDKNPSVLQSYIKIVKTNAKARIELNKIKSTNTKPKTDRFHNFTNDSFTACNNRGKQYKELYLIEGRQSAAGSVIDARNPDVQAVLGFRGVTANAYKRDINTIFDNVEWKNYCNIINYDIKSGNVKNVAYNKIIISTDADTDGYQISAGICAFHARFARPIVEAGLLYKVYPPLYLVDDKFHPFVRNKRELIDLYMNHIVNNFKVELKISGPLKKSELKDFVYDTEYYFDEISLIAKHYSISRGLIEILAFNFIMYMETKGVSFDKALHNTKFVTKLMSEIQHKYPEIILNGSTIQGVIDGHYQALTITQNFINKVMMFKDIYLHYGLYLKFSDNGSEYKDGTIGDLLAVSLKYQPAIKKRYKGLGEAQWWDLAETIMDPSKRILIQLTLDDVDRDLAIIEALHSGSVEAKRYRKKLMSEYKISRDEIDT